FEDRAIAGEREGDHHRRPGLYRPPRGHRRPGDRDRESSRMTLRASTIVASVFGIGYFEFAPGTIMSAVAVPLALLITVRAGAMSVVGACLIVFTIGVYACADHLRQTGRHVDPSECVIDDMAGPW